MQEALKSILDSLSETQRKKAEKCSNEKELLKFIEDEGVQLSDDMLGLIAGGLKHKDDKGHYVSGGNVPESHPIV